MIFLLGMAIAMPSFAATSSGWIDTEAAEKMAKEMRAAEMRLIDLDCRPDETAAAERTAFLMTWEENTDKRQWSWREAAAAVVKDYKHEFAGKGFKLVKEHSFTMPSGKKRSCALWHRKGAAGALAPNQPRSDR
jgi:hypothetical protein